MLGLVVQKPQGMQGHVVPSRPRSFCSWGEKVVPGAGISPQNFTFVLSFLFSLNFTPSIYFRLLNNNN